jgi:hypothetical protein
MISRILSVLSSMMAQEQEKEQHQELELQYMLSELRIKQDALTWQIDRFEKIVNFYLTGVTAISGAGVIVATSTFLGKYTAIALAFALMVFAGFGTSVYLRLCAAKAAVAIDYAACNAARLYFSNRFPQTLCYVEGTSFADLYYVWRRVVFSNQVIALFFVMNIVGGLSFSAGIGILMNQVPPLIGYPPFTFLFTIIFAVLNFFVFEYLLWLHMKGQMNRARRLNKEILDVAVSGTK